MSTNYKNLKRKEFLKNFTTKIKRRYVILETGKQLSPDFQETINSINTKVNQIIQVLNLKIEDRQIPYITLIAQFSSELSERSRIVIRNQATSNEFEEIIKDQADELGESISHCVEFLIASGYKEIIISPIDYDAEIVVAQKFVECAIIDILLDIAMFNSYSFLKKESKKEKHDFSYKKYDFFKSLNLKCFYECKTRKALYYSFAFSARVNEDDFDVDKYIEIWNCFIKKHFGELQHIEKNISEQLKQHVDYEELPANLYKRFSNKLPGAYLVLRTNKDRSEDLHPFLFSLFGIDKYEKGKIKIIPINEFEKYEPLLKNLDVSAFKIVKQPSKRTGKPTKNKSSKNKKGSKATVPPPKKRFKIALSFPGEYRNLVDPIANSLATIYGEEYILYDMFHRADFARVNLDLYLQNLYKDESELIVIFECEEYNSRDWCGVESRAIRTILNGKDNGRIMLIKCGKGSAEGFFDNVDGYIDASKYSSTEEIVKLIVERYEIQSKKST